MQSIPERKIESHTGVAFLRDLLIRQKLERSYVINSSGSLKKLINIRYLIPAVSE